MKIEKLTNELGWLVTGESGSLNEEIDRGKLINLLRDGGVVVFSGFDVALNDFAEFTRQFGQITWDVHDVSTSGEFMNLHSEGTYTQDPPDLVWFYCITPSPQGGETLLCDGVKLFRQINEDVKEILKEKKLAYNKSFSFKRWLSAAGESDIHKATAGLSDFPGVTYYLSDDEKLYIQYKQSAVRKTKFTGEESFCNTFLIAVDDKDGYQMTFEDGSEIPLPVIEHVKKVSQEIMLEWKLKSKDIIVMDNSRVLHGRKAYQGNERNVKSIYSKISI
jgi:alpha-ketoglutarate-dependent taurine dioxygenase